MSDQRDLVGLRMALADNERERVDLEDAIARHPEHIADVFAGHAAAIAAPYLHMIERLEQCSGEFDQGGRGKNMIPWSGYRYRIVGDPKEYWVRSGENWCSNVCDWGDYHHGDAPDIDIGRLQAEYERGGANEKLVEWFGTMSTPEAVAHLLILVIGW